MLPDKTNSLVSSYKLFSSLQTKNHNSSEKPPKFAENMNYDENFQGMFIDKPIYSYCVFKGTVFERSAGESTRLNFCTLYDCNFSNCDFRYCDFENTKFESLEDTCFIRNSNFSYGTMINTQFLSTDIFGTPFREMQMESCTFKDCKFDSFGFERTTIKNSSFENIDMSKIVFRFCDFKNVSFKNVTIHILDLAKNFGLINELQLHGEDIKIFYGQNNFISLDEALAILPNLMSYYLNEKEYYYVINILMLENRYDEIWYLLEEAFEYVILCKDFATLQDLCGLVVNLNVFKQEQLIQLYNIIKIKATPNDMSNHQMKSYSSYLENIKNILLDNPQKYPTASIIIRTNVAPHNISELTPLLKAIDTNIYQTNANIIPKIQITHHSPYEIEVIFHALLPELLNICQMFYYAFGGVKALKEIMSSRHEKADNKNKKKTNKKLKSKNISLNFGKINFQYHEECEEIVESIEYSIT